MSKDNNDKVQEEPSQDKASTSYDAKAEDSGTIAQGDRPTAFGPGATYVGDVQGNLTIIQGGQTIQAPSETSQKDKEQIATTSPETLEQEVEEEMDIEEILRLVGPDKSPKQYSHGARLKLKDKMNDAFNVSGLKEACDLLEIEYEDIPGSDRKAKIRELIAHCRRHMMLSKLIRVCEYIYSDRNWSLS